MLIQKKLEINSKQQNILPSRSVKREIIPSIIPKELLNTFTKLSSYNQSKPNKVDYEGDPETPRIPLHVFHLSLPLIHIGEKNVIAGFLFGLFCLTY